MHQGIRPPPRLGATVTRAVRLLLLMLLPGGLAAQEPRDGTAGGADRAAEHAAELPADPASGLARADSIRAAMADSRPPNRHSLDAADIVGLPFRLVGAPINFVLVTVPSFVIGELTLPRPPSFVMRTIRDLQAAGIHPGVRASIGPHSGPAAALRFDAVDPIELDAAFSVLGSQRYRLAGRLEADRIAVEAGTHWRRDAQVQFYGVGPDSPNRETLYRRETYDLGLAGVARIAPTLSFAANLGYEDNLVDTPIWADDDPSLFDEFDPATLFGAEDRLRYVRFGAGGELDLTRRASFQNRGVRLRAEAMQYDGVNGTTSDFHKLRFEAQGLVPLNGRQMLALHGRTDLTRGGSRDIPFYHLAHVGGEGTALGYPDRRFTDRDMAALQAEWRYEIWRDIHNSVRLESFLYFGEGAVGPRLVDIAPDDWRASYGFGFRAARTDRLLGLMYFGFSDESFRFGVGGEWEP